MCTIPQLVSAPLNPIPTEKHFRRSHPQCEHSYGQHIYMSEENNAKTLFNELNKHVKEINQQCTRTKQKCARTRTEIQLKK